MYSCSAPLFSFQMNPNIRPPPPTLTNNALQCVSKKFTVGKYSLNWQAPKIGQNFQLLAQVWTGAHIKVISGGEGGLGNVGTDLVIFKSNEASPWFPPREKILKIQNLQTARSDHFRALTLPFRQAHSGYNLTRILMGPTFFTIFSGLFAIL